MVYVGGCLRFFIGRGTSDFAIRGVLEGGLE